MGTTGSAAKTRESEKLSQIGSDKVVEVNYIMNRLRMRHGIQIC